jgi:hypothetical protein
MMNGGNILVLRDILGHADIKMTMVYAHFAPDHLEDAVTKIRFTISTGTANLWRHFAAELKNYKRTNTLIT